MKTIICPKCGAEQLASYDTCSYPHCDMVLIQEKRKHALKWWLNLTPKEQSDNIIK